MKANEIEVEFSVRLILKVTDWEKAEAGFNHLAESIGKTACEYLSNHVGIVRDSTEQIFEPSWMLGTVVKKRR